MFVQRLRFHPTSPTSRVRKREPGTAQQGRRARAPRAGRRRADPRAGVATPTTVPSLPHERLATLFTTHGLQFGRLTGPADLDPKQPGEDGLKVYVVPTDGHGQPLKAAGSFVVEAFDLAKGDNARIGRWEFPLDQAAKNWFGQAMLYTYVLPAPWQQQRPTSTRT